MQQERVLWEAEFDPKVRTYWLTAGALTLTATVVGILLLPIWFGVGLFVTQRYLRRMKCTLTDRSLRVSRGVLTRTEKTVPLDKITDLGLVQGPLMRYFGIEGLSVETAGQSTQGPLVRLQGIVGARKFRDAVLKQRDEVVAALGEQPAPSVEAALTHVPPSDDVLGDIRDTLHRIEQHLAGRGDA